MKNLIRILYAEDSDVLRRVILRQLRSFNITAVGQASNGQDLISLLEKDHDVVLLDLEMPVMDGNATMDYISENAPHLKVIITSFHNEELLMENYIKRGAKGFVSKEAFSHNIEILVEAIRKVAAGEIYVHKDLIYTSKSKYTNAQKEIIAMICQGMTNAEIAKIKGVNERAIEKQRNRIYAKIGGSKAIDFYRYAFSKGLHFLKKIKRK
jgi:two-component system response regulator DegU